MPELLCRHDSGEPRHLAFTAADGLAVRAEAGEEWSLEGIAVPWGQVVVADGMREMFQRGAFDPVEAVGAHLYGEHGHLRGDLPCGVIVAAEDRDAGLWVRTKISQTAAGRDLYTLAKDGVLSKFSIGFNDKPDGFRFDESGVLVHSASTLGEVSAVARPAYKTADITAVRTEDRPTSKGNTVTPEELAALQASLTELQTRSDEQARQLAVLTDRGGSGGQSPLPAKYRSLGAVVKALAPAKGQARTITDDELTELRAAYDEAMETRAYTGAVTGDLGATLKPAWIERDIKLITENRRIFELFSSERLPSEGMSVEYPKFNSKTGDVAKQAAEGDDLVYIEIDLTTASAGVDTYGAWSQLTRQLIERASVPFLNKTLQVQKISYGKVTNAAVRTVLSGWAGTNADTLPFADRGKAPAWEERVLQAASDFETNSVTGAPDVWIMGLTHFRQAALLTDTTGRPIFSVNGDSVNSIGNVDLRKLRLNIGGMPVFLDPGLTGTFSYIASKDALTTLESGPFSLTDENIINLSKAFSLYGYLAVTKNDAKGITKISHPAA